MKRRSFLASTAAASFLATRPAAPVLAASSRIVSIAVVITDITAETEPGPIVQVAETLLDKGVWITCAVALPEIGEKDDYLAETIHPLKDLGAGVDFAVHLPDLPKVSPYFQSRAVFQARQRLTRIMGDENGPIVLQSVVCEAADILNDPSGVRASGVRNVLVRPDENQQVRSEAWAGSVVRFLGGQTVAPQDGVSVGLDEAGEESRLIFYISARSLMSAPEGQLTTWSSTFAEELMNKEMAGQAALMSVPDLQLRDSFDQRRLMVVVLDLPENASAQQRETAGTFQQELKKAGIASSVKEHGTTFWANHSGDNASLVPIDVTCDQTGPVQMSASGPVAPGYAVRFSYPDSDEFGLDGCALLCLPVFEVTQNLSDRDLVEQLAGPNDRVLVVPESEITTPAARRRVLSGLLALRQEAVTRVVGLGELSNVLHTHEPVETRHRLTRVAAITASRTPPPKIDDAERARLLEDASHAWGYIEKHTNATTGLCPATVDSRPGGDMQQSVTMWDVGSNINGIVAATELGLIDKANAENIFKRILPNISGRHSQERLLPQGWIRSDRHRWGTRDFDGCDAGRLLSSLENMRRRFGMGDRLEKLVSSWDLEKIVISGEIHSVISGKIASTYGSHCAHYSALAFRRWGLDVASPYETFKANASGDGEMAMLETVAAIGPLGAEPLLLETMELGTSPESAYLAEVLFSAQEEEYSETGRLICVSETPIDRSPWFIYQGLELGSGPRSWRLDTVGHQPQYLTKEAAEEFLAVSTKAAFLWAAVKPGTYSRKLLSFARAKARNTVGFASSVDLKTQRRTAGYSDLNTNAIILQAIAHMLRDPA